MLINGTQTQFLYSTVSVEKKRTNHSDTLLKLNNKIIIGILCKYLWSATKYYLYRLCKSDFVYTCSFRDCANPSSRKTVPMIIIKVKIANFIKSILKSLVILAIWLALYGTIYSRIALVFALNRIFFSAIENGTVKQNSQSDFNISLG